MTDRLDTFGFVYLWYDRAFKRFYVGSHWGTLDDSYISSSVWMKNNYRKRPSDFKRRILKIVYDRKLLLIEEQRWLDMIDTNHLGSRYYNRCKTNNKQHWSLDDETRRVIAAKISLAKIGRSRGPDKYPRIRKIRESSGESSGCMFAFRLEKNIYDELHRAADDMGITRSELVRILINNFLTDNAANYL